MQYFNNLKTRENRQKFYNSKEWKDLRNFILSAKPLCVHCLKKKLVVVATEVDHIESIETNPKLCLEPRNLQPLCKSCHSKKTQSEQNRGLAKQQTIYNRKWDFQKLIVDI